MAKREFHPTRREDVDRLVDIVVNAYSGFFEGTQQERDRLRDDILKDFDSLDRDPLKDPGSGLYEDGELIASCLFHRYEVNVRGNLVPSAGIGGVCVALDRKKEKACRDMVHRFLDWAGSETRTLAMLYPFNPAFYRRMGFGFGTKMHRYSVPPSEFRGIGKQKVRLLAVKDAPDLHAIYDARARTTHGMALKELKSFEEMLKSTKVKAVGCREGNELTGYLVFEPKKRMRENGHQNILSVREMVFTTPTALSGLHAFLNSQSDQFRRVELNIQDELAQHMFLDPRDGSDEMIPSIFHSTDLAGVGLMYKVRDPKGFFDAQKAGFGPGSLSARFVLADSFDGPEPKAVAVRFEKGRCETIPKGSSVDIEVRMDIADFSSMAMGCVPLSYMHEHGLAQVDRERRLAELDAILRTPRPPVCLTTF